MRKKGDKIMRSRVAVWGAVLATMLAIAIPNTAECG
jgi:hypothetical protein